MSECNTDQLAARVNRGAMMLDRHFPGWALNIDPSKIDMCSTSSCVLALSYGWAAECVPSYMKGLRLLRQREGFLPEDCGFTLMGESPWPWNTLNELWGDEVRMRTSGVQSGTEEQREVRDRESATEAPPTRPEASLIEAGRKGVVDLYLAATGRPESDRVLVEAMFS